MSPRVICFFLLVATFGACSHSPESPFYAVVDNNFLWEQYENSRNSPSNAHGIVLQILSILQNNNKTEYIVPFLLEHIQQNPDNPFHSYYIYLIARNYAEQGQKELACVYARRAIASNINVEGISIQQESFTLLSQLSTRPWEQTSALLAKNQHPASTDAQQANNLYTIAQHYNDMGHWSEMYQAYLEYLSLETNYESYRYKQVLHWVSRYNSDRSWTFNSLDTLVANIRSALAQKDTSRLLRYRAKDSFFTMSWNQELFDENSSIRTFNITPFLRRSTVQYSSRLDSASNAKEAYLRTWGWSYRIPTWYFYFKRVDFPADNSVHGNWEWAGIFFGDTL